MINLGLVGSGRWGKNYIKTIKNTDKVNLVGIYDIVEENHLRKQLEGILEEDTHIEKSFEQLCKNIDGLIIATPTHTHEFYIKKAIKNGVGYILCEKPMCCDKAEIIEIRSAISSFKNLFIGHTYLYNNALNTAIDMVKNGAIGDLCYISSERLNFGPVRNDMNAVSDLAVHDISIFNNFFGSVPTTIDAYGYDIMNRGIEDIVNISLFYEKIPVHIKAGWAYPEKVRKISFIGTSGMLLFDELDPSVLYHHHKKICIENNEYYKEVDLGGNPVSITNKKMPLNMQIEDFARKIQNKEEFGNIEFSTGVMDTILDINSKIWEKNK